MLYIVATPIGNLGDITVRAVETLQTVDTIFCEDTRRAAILCAHYDITTPLRSCHAHNEQRMISKMITLLQQGKSCAYISDAGTPTISDPGVRLTHAAHTHGFRVVPIPGVSAVHALISASGEGAHPYLFYGFLPRKAGARRRIVHSLSELGYPFLLFESPHRIINLCEIMVECIPQMMVVVGRELTKRFEEIRRGVASEHLEYFSGKKIMGEFSILVTNTVVH